MTWIEFLKLLAETPTKEIQTKIIWINGKSINGLVTSGSISMDGKSSMRRTCSLSLVTDTIDLKDYDWAYGVEYSVEIGVKNTTNFNGSLEGDIPEYISNNSPIIEENDIVWFKQGHFLLNSYNYSLSLASANISISGKDKMSKLNGDMGGYITVNTELNKYLDEDGNQKEMTIEELIISLLTTYGLENENNINIGDLPDGRELLEYRGYEPLYMAGKNKTKENGGGFDITETFKSVTSISTNPLKDTDNQIVTDFTVIDGLIGQSTGTFKKKNNSDDWRAFKFDYGSLIGYASTGLTYPGTLESKPGETVVTILDKIVNVLGVYEYYYDLNGKFQFKEKASSKYFNGVSSNNPLANDIPIKINPKINDYTYTFKDNKLITAISSSPNIGNIKNEFVIWGEKTSTAGGKVSIHARIAIQDKPDNYKGYNASDYDWRELIYQMALDGYDNNLYKPYYADMLQFWRLLYDPEGSAKDGYIVASKSSDDDDEAIVDSEYAGWHKDVIFNPETLLFWFDFIDYNEEKNNNLENIKINNIGRRTKVVNDNKAQAIHFTQAPPLVLYPKGTTAPIVNKGEKVLQVSEEIFDLLNQSSKSASCLSVLETTINQHINAQESLSLSALPVFQLQPNDIIKVDNGDTNPTTGSYEINSLSYSLGLTTSMTISCSKLQPMIGAANS